MTCAEARVLLDALIDGELEPDEEMTLQAHLAQCAGCAHEGEERREWIETIAGSFDRGLDGVEPGPAERDRTAAAMVAASRGRPALLGRLAAAIVVALALGAVTYAVSRPPQDQIARVVEAMKEREVRDARLRALSLEIERDLLEARRVVGDRPEDPIARVVAVGARNLEDQVDPPRPLNVPLPEMVALTGSPDPRLRRSARAGLRDVGPDRLPELRGAFQQAPHADREFVVHLLADLEHPAQQVAVTREFNGATIAVTQQTDGRVRVVAPGLQVEARNMGELLRKHEDLCRKYSISGSEGLVNLGGQMAGVDWRGRADLLFRTGTWDENVSRDAYRAWVSRRWTDAREVERRMEEYSERCRPAADARPPVPVNVEAILKNVEVLTRKELGRAQVSIESEMKALETRLKSFEELRARARGLRVLAEQVTRDR